MYVKLQDDKSLVVTVNTTIYRGENNADTIVFLVPEQYGNIKTADCTMLIRYILPNGTGKSESLKMLPDMYNGFIQYAVQVDTKLTSEVGDILLWLSLISYQDFVVLKSGELTIKIYPSIEIEKHMPPEDLDQLDQLSLEVSVLKNTKADNLIYDQMDGSLQLSASGNPIGDEVIVTGSGGDYNIIDGGGAAK